MKNKLTYYALILFELIFLFLPYSVNDIFRMIPIRLLACVIFVGIYFIERIFLKGTYRRINKILAILFSLFILLSSLSLIVTTSKMTTIYTILKFLFYGLTFYAIYTSDFSKEQYKKLFKIFLIASSLLMLYGIITYIFNFNLNYNGIYKYHGAKGRIYTTFNNPIYYGMFCIIFFITLLYILLEKNNMNKRWFVFPMLFLTTINIYLTFTRSTYMLAYVSIFFILLFNINKIKKLYKIFLMIIIFFIISFLLVPGSFAVTESAIIQLVPSKILKIFHVEKVNDNEYEVKIDEDNDYVYIGTNNNEIVDGSMLTRSEFKKLAKRVIKDNRYLGVGLGAYKNYLEVEKNHQKYISGKFGYPHNNYLHILVETGIFTFIIFLLILIYVVLVYCYQYLKTRKKGYLYLLVSWICVILLCFYESLFYDSQIIPIYIVVTVLLFKHIEFDEIEKSKKVMFISSSGGHLTQLLKLKELFDCYDYVLITEKTDVTMDMKEQYQLEYLKYGSRKYIVKYLFVSVCNCVKSLILFLKYNPNVIVTTGTHTAVVMCYLGWMFKKKVIYIESFAKSKSPTLSGRLVYPIATTFIVQWESMLKVYPKAKYFGGIY